jgi:hypothetical protein
VLSPSQSVNSPAREIHSVGLSQLGRPSGQFRIVTKFPTPATHLSIADILYTV